MNDMTNFGSVGADARSEVEGDDHLKAEVLLTEAQRKQAQIEEWAARFGGSALFINPAHVRPWTGNARQYADLSYDNASLLIESIRTEGQRVAAVVRPIVDPVYKFEAITGTRRLFAANWLCQNNHEVPFIAICRHLTDEKAFHEADLENRIRDDVTVLERARNYAAALPLYFGNRKGHMAAALGTSNSQITKYLSVATLPDVVIEAFGGENVPLAQGHDIAKALADAQRASHILEEAARLAESRRIALLRGENPVPAGVVGRKLLNCHKEPHRVAEKTVLLSSAGKPLATVLNIRKKGLTLRLHAGSGANGSELGAALSGLLEELSATGEFHIR